MVCWVDSTSALTVFTNADATWYPRFKLTAVTLRKLTLKKFSGHHYMKKLGIPRGKNLSRGLILVYVLEVPPIYHPIHFAAVVKQWTKGRWRQQSFQTKFPSLHFLFWLLRCPCCLCFTSYLCYLVSYVPLNASVFLVASDVPISVVDSVVLIASVPPVTSFAIFASVCLIAAFLLLTMLSSLPMFPLLPMLPSLP